VHHGPRRGGDVGGDDAEAKAVERTADLGDGVPPVGAGDAHHQHLIPRARHPHLSFQETDRGRSISVSPDPDKLTAGRRRPGVGVAL
jgi:hypothetical protein